MILYGNSLKKLDGPSYQFSGIKWNKAVSSQMLSEHLDIGLGHTTKLTWILEGDYLVLPLP